MTSQGWDELRSSPSVTEEASRLDALFRSIELEANLLGSSTIASGVGPTSKAGLAGGGDVPYDRRVVRTPVEPLSVSRVHWCFCAAQLRSEPPPPNDASTERCSTNPPLPSPIPWQAQLQRQASNITASPSSGGREVSEALSLGDWDTRARGNGNSNGGAMGMDNMGPVGGMGRSSVQSGRSSVQSAGSGGGGAGDGGHPSPSRMSTPTDELAQDQHAESVMVLLEEVWSRVQDLEGRLAHNGGPGPDGVADAAGLAYMQVRLGRGQGRGWGWGLDWNCRRGMWVCNLIYYAPSFVQHTLYYVRWCRLGNYWQRRGTVRAS